MKRGRSWALGMAIIAVAISAGAEQMSVQVRTAVLRASPSVLAAAVAKAKYADAVTVVERSGAWVHARTADGPSGWIHQSALTRQRIVLRAGDETVEAGASAREVSLAGKGFNEDIEKEFRKTNTEMDYTWVDRMEQMEVAPARIAAFLREGGVAPQGGGK